MRRASLVDNVVALAMVSGKLKIPVDDGNEIGDDDDNTALPDQDNIDVATDEICHSIFSLFRLTVVIQNLSTRDRLERMERIDVSAYEGHDINHIKEKYPLSEKSGSYLSERLGKANTKRRQILQYNEKHHQKIVGAVQGGMVPGGDGGILGFHESDYMSEAASSDMQTTVSTVNEDNIASFYRPDNNDNQSETGYSQTSYAYHRDQPSVPISFVFHLHRPGMTGNLSNARTVFGS
jgi:hypothetical protein